MNQRTRASVYGLGTLAQDFMTPLVAFSLILVGAPWWKHFNLRELSYC